MALVRSFRPDQNRTSPPWQRRPQSDQIRGDYTIRMRSSWDGAERGDSEGEIYVLVLYLPVVAVLQPVADLVFGLEQEVFESGRSLPANAQLVLQHPHAADAHTRRRVRGHWRRKRVDEVNSVLFNSKIHNNDSK